MTSIPPNTALYIKNLNDKIKKEELRTQLYNLFTPYGKIISVVAKKGQKMKGQAFIVFKDLAGATSALRSLDGELFYDKQMHIEYAKTKSWATLKQEDPNFIPPSFLKASASAIASQGKVTVSRAQLENERKRGRDVDMEGEDGTGKKKKQDGDEDDMEMDEDESGPPQAAPTNVASATLRCENLPNEVTDDVLAVLFQQYPGFISTHVSNTVGANKSKSAHVRYDQVDQAVTAKEALDGFTLKKGWIMKVYFA